MFLKKHGFYRYPVSATERDLIPQKSFINLSRHLRVSFSFLKLRSWQQKWIFWSSLRNPILAIYLISFLGVIVFSGQFIVRNIIVWIPSCPSRIIFHKPCKVLIALPAHHAWQKTKFNNEYSQSNWKSKKVYDKWTRRCASIIAALLSGKDLLNGLVLSKTVLYIEELYESSHNIQNVFGHKCICFLSQRRMYRYIILKLSVFGHQVAAPCAETFVHLTFLVAASELFHQHPSKEWNETVIQKHFLAQDSYLINSLYVSFTCTS